MAEILKVYTVDQLKTLIQNYLSSLNVNLTDYNEGSILEAITDAVARVTSITGFDYVKAIREVIPIAFQQGLGFAPLSATTAQGYIRFYRLPYISVIYNSTGTSVLINNNGTTLTFTVTGGPGGENVLVDLTTYTTIQSVVTYINGLAGAFAVTKVRDGNSSDIYNYVSREMIGKYTYQYVAGFDLCPIAYSLVNIPTGVYVQTNDGIQIVTLATNSVPAGESTSGQITSETVETGSSQVVNIRDINTISGYGDITTPITGMETGYAINDSAFTPGLDDETVADQIARFNDAVSGLARSNRYGIQFYVSEVNGVRSVTVKPKSPIPGWNTIIVDNGTGTASAALLAEVTKVVEGVYSDLTNYPGCQAEGLNFVVKAPTQDVVTITVTITRIGETSNITDITNSVTSTIEQFVNSLLLGEDIIHSALLTKAKQSHPAIYDIEILIDGVEGNYSVDDANVARTGTAVGAPVSVSIVTIPSAL